MNASSAFFDTNVLLYLLSADAARADRAEALLAGGGHISVQVLNEFAAICARKLKMPWEEVRDVLAIVRTVCVTHSLTPHAHDRAMPVCARYQLSFYDACIVAAASIAGCKLLYSEDLQHGQLIEQLEIRNPFSDV
jgi:predicted nucleic acid-binding protein